MPLSWEAPSHRLMRDVLATGGPGGSPLGSLALRETLGRNWVEPVEEYYDLLTSRMRSLDIWSTEYLQVLNGDDPVLEWVKGTGLRPILKGLSQEDLASFMEEYRLRLRQTYLQRPDGTTLFPFKRLFIVGQIQAR